MSSIGYLDALHPTLRHYLALGASFATATALRSVCFNPNWPIFGKDLRENLAPVERSDIAWTYIAATRLFDLVLYIYIWRRETGGHRSRTDAPLLGVLLSCIERVPLYLLLSHFFLLSYKTLGQVFLTDMFSSSAAMYVISKMEPKKVAFFPSPASTATPGEILQDRTKLETIVYGIGLSTLLNSLYSYVAERLYLGQLIRDNVLDNEIPAYLSAWKPALAEAMKNPTIAIPILRNHAEPLSMPGHILHSLPTSIFIAILALVYLPQKSPFNLAALVTILTFPTNALAVFNLLPVNPTASLAIGAENALKAASAAYIIAWITEEWRRPLAVNGGRRAIKGQLTDAENEGILKDVTHDVSANEVVIVQKDSITFREVQ